MTLPQVLVDEVERLITEGSLTLRAIARQTGVSRGSVTAIASGQRKLQPLPESPFVLNGPTTKCPTCGHKAQQPCNICATKKTEVPSMCSGPDDPSLLSIKLLSEDQRDRYEEKHEKKIQRSCTPLGTESPHETRFGKLATESPTSIPESYPSTSYLFEKGDS